MLKNRSTTEKRRHVRIQKNLPIKINNGDFDIITETENISCNGAYCQVNRYLAPLTKIKTRILLPSQTKKKRQYIECSGVVVRSEKSGKKTKEKYNVAIYFSEIDKSNMLKINRFINDRANQTKSR